MLYLKNALTINFTPYTGLVVWRWVVIISGWPNLRMAFIGANTNVSSKSGLKHWDSARVGAGAAPIKTAAGWLEIYHGANGKRQYCLGAFLMDLNDPSKVLARTEEPIMVTTADYELHGFFGEVVFTNGHIVNGDELTIYYGAADEFVCGAKFSLKEILEVLAFYH